MLTTFFAPNKSEVQSNGKLTVYPLVPLEANQGWKLELFELLEPIKPHYHKTQRRIILVVEGELKAFYGSGEPVVLRSGELAHVDPRIIHSLIQEASLRFFSIDFSGFSFPEDVFLDMPQRISQWTPTNAEFLSPLEVQYFVSRIDLGSYAVYELVAGDAVGKKWSVALLEIQDSPRHFHQIERELFVVVGGELDIEIDGIHRILGVGESVVVVPGMIHQLRSALKSPARALCFSFPAFDPADMHCVE